MGGTRRHARLSLSLCAREFLSPNFVRECMPRGGERRRISEESDGESGPGLRDSCWTQSVPKQQAKYRLSAKLLQSG